MLHRITSLAVFLLVLTSYVLAQHRHESAPEKSKEEIKNQEWRTYGKIFTLEETTPLTSLLEKKDGNMESEVLFEGRVLDVCNGKGCWMVVGDSVTHVRVEFKDYGFFVPWDSEGKKVKIQGVLGSKKISKEMSEHMAKEMTRPPVEGGNVEGEREITLFVASGVAMESGSEIDEEQRAVIEGKKVKEGHEHKEHVH